jgi:uncharacterized SAM-binding protein YcdF (DUF218 family)
LSASAFDLPDEQAAARIVAYLDLDAPPERADLAFVFGTRHAQPAHIAAGLFRQGIVEWVVFTGGKNRLNGQPEAQSHLEIALAQGVPRQRIIVESASNNTLENVVLALPMLEDCGIVTELRSVVAVCKWYHCRRAVMTLKAHLPEGVRYYTQTYEPEDVRRDGWPQNPQALRRVHKEWQALPRYLAQGDIAEVRFDGQAFV